MMNIFLLVTLVVSGLPKGEGQNYGERLLARLNTDIRQMNTLMMTIQQHYREERAKNSLLPTPKDYGSTMRRASTAIGRALRLMESIEAPERQVDQGSNNKIIVSADATDILRRSLILDGESPQWTRRSNNKNNNLEWKTNFYKALSRALKEEFQDDKMIQDHVHDGFVPPVTKQRTGN